MVLVVKKTTRLDGIATPPGSKSQSIRGLLLALLAKGTSTLGNVLASEDLRDAMSVCRALGAKITLHDTHCVLNSEGLPFLTHLPQINTGNSGITTHFIMPILGLRRHADHPVVLDCGEQMRARPIHPLVTALRSLGLKIDYLEQEGRLPVRIQGALNGGCVEVDGLTSQYVSALLMALPCATMDSDVVVYALQERSYMEMTLAWLDAQSIRYEHRHEENLDRFFIQGNQRYQAFEQVISGDFSSASYLIAAAVLIPGRVVLTGLDMQDPQGDKRLVALLQTMGADIKETSSGLVIQGGAALKGMVIDANDIPDLLPTLAVIGTYAEGETSIVNVKHARIKETDRIHSMTEGLRRMGARIDEHPDGMTIYSSALRGVQVKGYDDHRTVMALAVAGMIAEGITLIDDAHAIRKTFPTFVTLMQSLGADLHHD